MSRCFPFPPPGYEKKARTDDVVLLKKEKHKEKMHKKEKRDKEKRESKEKREKEGRDGKHKDKKDKKEKHREKKKDKDTDRDKDKSKISAADEKGFPGHAQGPNAGKLHEKEIKQNDKKGVLFEDRLTKQYASNNGENARQNKHLVEENKDSKFLQELDKRIRDSDGGAGKQLVQKFTIADHRKDEGTVRLVAKSSGTWPDRNEKLQDKGIDARKIDEIGIWAEARPIGNATVQNNAGKFHPRVDEKPRSLEKNFDKALEATVEGTERVKGKKDDKRGDKRKEKDKEKKGHGKDKDRDKEKKKEKKAKVRVEHKNREQNKVKESNKVGPIGSNFSLQVPRHNHDNSIIGGNLMKRKEIESNGVLHGNDNLPSKLPRPSPSHLSTENGRTLEPCQISLLNASDRLGAATNVKVDNKQRKINGTIEALPSAVPSNKTPTAPPLASDSVTEAPTKSPHPDAKYLSRVYSVPKADEWSSFDDQDQEWLFGSGSQERKPVVKSSEVGDTLRVWAEAVHIEPADVFALPYVIPY